jgi:hypothetical protein
VAHLDSVVVYQPEIVLVNGVWITSMRAVLRTISSFQWIAASTDTYIGFAFDWRFLAVGRMIAMFAISAVYRIVNGALGAFHRRAVLR